MERTASKLNRIVTLIRKGHLDVLWLEIRRRLNSNSSAFCLRRDLFVPFQAPAASIPLTVRPLCDSDVAMLLDTNAADIAGEGIYLRMSRRDLLKRDIPTCYVAVTAEKKPCYMQWLIGSSANAQIQSYFKGIFPVLAADEALLEGAFTLEAYRGQRIMPCAMAQIAECGAELGARWVITFVAEDNVPSLKGCKRAGFAPYLVRKEQWRLFRRRLTFTPLPAGTAYPFELKREISTSTSP